MYFEEFKVLCCTKIMSHRTSKRKPQECNKLYRSGKATEPVLTDRSMRYIISQMKRAGEPEWLQKS